MKWRLGRIPYWVQALLSITAALLAGGAIVVSIATDDTTTANRPAPENVVVKVNKAPDDGKPTTTIQVPAPVVAQTDAALEDGLKDEAPAAAPAAEIEAAQEQIGKVKTTLPPLPTAGASAGFRGCVTRFVSNQSSRHGVRPIYQVLHYTVSPNRPGWSDVNAVVALFNVLRSQASSTFVLDAEGHCAYIVPIEAKAWTQAAGNPLSVSYEIINSGRESSFMGTPGYSKLSSVMREVSRRTGIPMRTGSVILGRSGIVQHKDGGLAWGGHVDITPFSKSQVIKAVTTNTCSTSTCKKAARTRSLRKRNIATHKTLRDRNCGFPSKSHGKCLFYNRRHLAIHRAAKKEHIRL
jgi:hypothetical protein